MTDTTDEQDKNCDDRRPANELYSAKADAGERQAKHLVARPGLLLNVTENDL
jgi:hypothetical protein